MKVFDKCAACGKEEAQGDYNLCLKDEKEFLGQDLSYKGVEDDISHNRDTGNDAIYAGFVGYEKELQITGQDTLAN